MTKDEILESCDHDLEMLDYSEVLKAMNIYAKQESIAFGKFISANGWQQYDEPDRWICPSNNKDVITTKQLYEKYDAKRT